MTRQRGTRRRGFEQVERDRQRERVVLQRAAAGGYMLVGPSAQTWSVDPTTGRLVGPVSELEHRLVRDLIGRGRLDGAKPEWVRRPDGGQDLATPLTAVRTTVCAAKPTISTPDVAAARRAVDALDVTDRIETDEADTHHSADTHSADSADGVDRPHGDHPGDSRGDGGGPDGWSR